MIKKGWAEKLDKSAIPNIKNLVDVQLHPGFDPNRDYSLPWQSGMTGIAYNDKLTDPVLSIDDLLDQSEAEGQDHGPQLDGRRADMRDAGERRRSRRR